MQDEVLHFSKSHLPESVGELNVHKIFGQASGRQYFRVSNQSQSYVVMVIPQEAMSASHQMIKLRDGAPEELPFLNVQKYLEKHELPVPKVLAYDSEKRMMLLQDLGDQSFESLILKTEGEFFYFYYQKALDLLIDFQMRTQDFDESCIAFYRGFDADLFNWEFDHFLEFGIEDHLKLKVAEEDRKVFQQFSRDVTNRLLDMPTGLVHRDFQSRNIMCHGYDFYLIDFQDLMQGPVVYDLVALLRDSYVLISQESLGKLLKYYYEKLPEEHLYYNQPEGLQRDFFLQTLQRKMKDYGRFQFMSSQKQNDSFLEFMPLTLVYIKLALAEFPEYENLRQILAKYIKELA